jgi:hypothetical protein
LLRQILPDEAIEALGKERELLERIRVFADRFDSSSADARTVAELLAHIEDMFLLVVVGEVKAGKSAFINALLHADVCPEGPLPLTTKVEVLGYGETEGAVATEPHVVRRTVPVEALRQMNVVDTPGTNSPLKRHQEITEAFLPRADIVFFVTSIDCPLTQTEIQLLRHIHGRWRKEIACILAKIDMHPERDRDVVLEYLHDSFREFLGFNPPVFPVSAHEARRAHRAGDDEALRRSGMPEVERYIVENLSESQRVLLKLRSPLGSVHEVLGNIDATAAARAALLDRDFAGWTAIQEQVSFAATSVAERAERHLAPITVAFENLEARGRSYLREVIRLRRLRLLADEGRFRDGFERQVVRGAIDDIESKVEAAVRWLGEETQSLWERSLSHFNETVALARYRGEIAAGAGPRFQETRRETLEGIVEGARGNLRTWSVEVECARVRELASKSVARLLGTEVLAAGLGATIAATVGGVASGVGILLAAGIALGGFLILPARRQRAVDGFELRVRHARDAVLTALREAIGSEAHRAATAVLDAFAPFRDFYEGRRRNLADVRREAQAFQEEVSRLQASLE